MSRMKCIIFLGVLVFLIHESVFCVNTRFKERYSWRTLNFEFPDEETRQSLINSGEYIPTANVPVGIEIWRDRFFISIPRWRLGVLSTLNYFSLSESPAGSSPTLVPYPNFESNRIRPNQTNFNNSLISVCQVKVDACDRLWFVDTGTNNMARTTENLARARLFIVDLRTDQIIRSYQFDASVAPNDSVMGGNIAVDVTADSADSCEKAFAYVADFNAYRLVVYSYEQNLGWRIRHPYFYLDPFSSAFHIGGLTDVWTDGIFGAALSPIRRDGFRILYFSSLVTNNQFAVSTRYLRDRDLATNTTVLLQAYRFLGSRGRNMQTTHQMMHEPTGTLFYTLTNKNGIGCWNSFRFPNNFSPETNFILATDNVTMIFNNGIIFDKGDNLWLISNRLVVSNARGLRENEVNFRLFVAPVRDVLRGTICENISGNKGDGFWSASISSSNVLNSAIKDDSNNFNSGNDDWSNIFNLGSSNSGSSTTNSENSRFSSGSGGSSGSSNFESGSYRDNDNVVYPPIPVFLRRK